MAPLREPYKTSGGENHCAALPFYRYAFLPYQCNPHRPLAASMAPMLAATPDATPEQNSNSSRSHAPRHERLFLRFAVGRVTNLVVFVEINHQRGAGGLCPAMRRIGMHIGPALDT